MPPPIKISKYVIDRLSAAVDGCTGNLYATFQNNSIIVIGLCLHHSNSSEDVLSLPTEVDLCGIFEINSQTASLINVSKLCNDIDVTDCPLYLHQRIGGELSVNYFINDRIERSKYVELNENDIYSDFIHLRLKTQVPLLCEVNPEAISNGLSHIKNKITSGSMAFNILNTNIFIFGTSNERGFTGISGDPTVEDVLKYNGEKDDCSIKRNKSDITQIDVILVKMFKNVTLDPYVESNVKHAAIVHVDKKLCQNLNMLIQIDSLSMVNKSTKLNDLYEIMVESAIRSLRLLKKPLLKQFSENAGDHSNIFCPEIFHFYPEGCGHFVTRIYDKNCNELEMQSDRKVMHELYMLPVTQPLFRKSNRYLFPEEETTDRIINPHRVIQMHTDGGEIAVVRGKYKYYHYCQDKMDDDGWGCAYRSLQTLASWFLMQGYTDKSAPSFKEIQQCLVDIGDKPTNFVDSRQWIGSTEVNFVLGSLLNVTSKIIYVSSGEELGTKGPELINHFKVHGSPVMIGGGVLAHTILGVNYNQQTGKLKFLILDPHYTGKEDLKIIQNKGWCGWKGVEFWDKKSYYNMCLPQVPICI